MPRGTYAARFSVIILFAGCGGLHNGSIPSLDQAPSSPNAKLHGETFSGRTGHVRCGVGGYGRHYADFDVSGQASGPFPGTFTAKGTWQWGGFASKAPVAAEMFEKFRLTSSSRRIFGSVAAHNAAPKFANCRRFDDSQVPYKSGLSHGRSSLRIVRYGSFEQSFLTL